MKTIIMSDLHGELPKIKESFDLLLICGDVCPVWNHLRTYQWEWLNNEFVDWVNLLPYKDDRFSQVVMIAGNHDFIFEGLGKRKKEDWLKKMNGKLVYLDNEEYTFTYFSNNPPQEYRIFGSPYCKVFGNWAFMREDLDKYYSMIPEGLDFLITHDAADIDGLGMINDKPWKGVNAGNTVLAEYVKKVKPKFYFCGHIHSGRHEIEKTEEGVVNANVSIMDESYDPVNDPLILDIENDRIVNSNLYE